MSRYGGEFRLQSQRTVMRRSTGAEKLTPLLLAATLIVLDPRGQVSVAPGLVPQPPVQASLVWPHCAASAKPSCAAVSVAPDAPVASTVIDVAPVKVGSIR